jgi:hypothetical protein
VYGEIALAAQKPLFIPRQGNRSYKSKRPPIFTVEVDR